MSYVQGQMKHVRIYIGLVVTVGFGLFGGTGSIAEAADSEAEGARLVKKAVDAHGAMRLDGAQVDFRFRDQRFRMTRQGGRYQYERWSDQRGRKLHDVLTNAGLTRAIDGLDAVVAENLRVGIANGVNSVVYFASLPFPLLDPAVRPRYLGKKTIKGVEYHTVEVTFTKVGGGDDHDDVFVYWIRNDTHHIDYLAYRYHVGKGGVRFRAAYGRTIVNGITFQHYENYEHDDLRVDLKTLGGLYEAKKLNLLSKVETKEVSVKRM